MPAKRIITLSLLGLVSLISVARLLHKPVGAQARISNQPQSRLVGITAVAAGQPIVNIACPSVSTIEACVTPATNTGPAAGIAIQAGTSGQRIEVMMTGIAMCTFDNLPVVMDVVTVAATGLCHDVAGTVYGVSNLVGFEGRVTETVDSTHAYVTMIHPASTGYAIDLSTLTATGTRSDTTFLRGDGTWSAGVSGARGAVGATGATGATGTAATISIGTTSTGPAAVTNSGTSSAAVFNFTIPQGIQGATGATGTAASIAIGTVTSLAAGATPTVTNVGTNNAAILNFGFPAPYLKGTSGTITGTLLAAGGFDTGTATVAGATAGMPCGGVTATDGTTLNSYTLSCTVTGSGSNNVTISIASPVVGTPPTKSYNFRIWP